jgi:hypothetical protein
MVEDSKLQDVPGSMGMKWGILDTTPGLRLYASSGEHFLFIMYSSTEVTQNGVTYKNGWNYLKLSGGTLASITDISGYKWVISTGQ